MSTKERSSADYTGRMETPFFDQELFAGGAEEQWGLRVAALAAESPFQSVFEQGRTGTDLLKPEKPEAVDEELLPEHQVGVIAGEDRERIENTLDVPWRWICKISIKKWGTDDPEGGGTGVLISDRHVLTAAHIVYRVYKDVTKYELDVIPALNWDKEPFGRYRATSKPKIPMRFTPDPKHLHYLEFDYALIKLTEAIGRKRFGKLNGERLCYWGHPQCGGSTFFIRLAPDRLRNQKASTAGYPSGKQQNTLFSASGTLHDVDVPVPGRRRTMSITADMTEGQSGSPVWLRDGRRLDLVGIAVSAGHEQNRVVRVTRELIRQVRAWIEDDGDIPTMEDDEVAPDLEQEEEEELYEFEGAEEQGEWEDEDDESEAEELWEKPEEGELVPQPDQEEDEYLDSENDEKELEGEVRPAIQKESATSAAIKREMKFEIQTKNVVWRTGGKKTERLPRKFGPTDNRFLHKGTKGKPAKGGEEGTAVELQSEAHGVLEFETPKWFGDWCELKERIQEAVDMVDAINKSKVIRSVGGVATVEFPFDVSHLKRTKAFPQGLKDGESLEVEILDTTWLARIQASESFELSQFESYLTEHMPADRVRSITDSAKKILKDANTAKIPDTHLMNLKSFLQVIIEHITEAQHWNLGKTKLAKENISLMSRTSLSSMYRELLSMDEKKLFKAIVKSDAILKEVGVTRKTLIFPSGFTGRKSPGPKIHNWLVSIYSQDRDLLSSLGGDNRAMGRFPVETNEKSPTKLVRFEARKTSGHVQDRPVVDKKNARGDVVLGGWVGFAKEVFEAAHTKRSPKGSGTELVFEPMKCP